MPFPLHQQHSSNSGRLSLASHSTTESRRHESTSIDGSVLGPAPPLLASLVPQGNLSSAPASPVSTPSRFSAVDPQSGERLDNASSLEKPFVNSTTICFHHPFHQASTTTTTHEPSAAAHGRPSHPLSKCCLLIKEGSAHHMGPRKRAISRREHISTLAPLTFAHSLPFRMELMLYAQDTRYEKHKIYIDLDIRENYKIDEALTLQRKIHLRKAVGKWTIRYAPIDQHDGPLELDIFILERRIHKLLAQQNRMAWRHQIRSRKEFSERNPSSEDRLLTQNEWEALNYALKQQGNGETLAVRMRDSLLPMLTAGSASARRSTTTPRKTTSDAHSLSRASVPALLHNGMEEMNSPRGTVHHHVDESGQLYLDDQQTIVADDEGDVLHSARDYLLKSARASSHAPLVHSPLSSRTAATTASPVHSARVPDWDSKTHPREFDRTKYAQRPRKYSYDWYKQQLEEKKPSNPHSERDDLFLSLQQEHEDLLQQMLDAQEQPPTTTEEFLRRQQWQSPNPPAEPQSEAYYHHNGGDQHDGARSLLGEFSPVSPKNSEFKSASPFISSHQAPRNGSHIPSHSPLFNRDSPSRSNFPSASSHPGRSASSNGPQEPKKPSSPRIKGSRDSGAAGSRTGASSPSNAVPHHHFHSLNNGVPAISLQRSQSSPQMKSSMNNWRHAHSSNNTLHSISSPLHSKSTTSLSIHSPVSQLNNSSSGPPHYPHVSKSTKRRQHLEELSNQHFNPSLSTEHQHSVNHVSSTDPSVYSTEASQDSFIPEESSTQEIDNNHLPQSEGVTHSPQTRSVSDMERNLLEDDSHSEGSLDLYAGFDDWKEKQSQHQDDSLVPPVDLEHNVAALPK